LIYSWRKNHQGYALFIPLATTFDYISFWREYEVITDYLKDCNPPENRIEYEATYNILKKEGLEAIAKEDAVWIEHITNKLSELISKCYYYDPRMMAGWLQQLIGQAQQNVHLNPALLDLINRAHVALAQSNLKEMQEVAHSLYAITGNVDKPQTRFMKSGITL
jgi:hypothetical protein